MSRPALFLGVDGGGTKTAFCLVGADGDVVSRRRAGTMYYFDADLGIVPRVLDEGVRQVCADAGVGPGDIAYAFVGIPGYGEASRDLPALDAAPRGVLGHDRYRCGNDMVCGWAGSLGGEDGINVVSGTGSIAYGERRGTGARVGGWGELFGDEGSAYWVGIAGLRAVTRMIDGRRPRTGLVEHVLAPLGLAHEHDLIDVVLNRWRGDRARIAGLARAVAAAATDGDATAADILERAGIELAGLVRVARTGLGYGPGETVPVSWSGGMFRSDHVLAAFRRALDTGEEPYALRSPLLAPDLGAAVHAARLAGTPLDGPAVQQLVDTEAP